jgi:hypothetical protein
MTGGSGRPTASGSRTPSPPESRPLSRIVPSWIPRPARIWFLVGIAATSVVILKDSSALLGLVQSAGERSYDASAFSGFKLKFWDVRDLAEAIRIWFQAANVLEVRKLIGWHLAVDLILFVPAYCILLHRLLKKVGATRPVNRNLVIALFVVDEIETVVSLLVLVVPSPPLSATWALIAIQFFSTAKWVLLVAAVLTAFFLWWAPDVKGEIGLESFSRAVAAARAGKAQAPAHALAGLIVLIAIFAGAIGLPAGGPLDQIPDVIRYQLGDHLGVWLLSSVGLLLFASAVLVAGLLSTDPAHDEVRGAALSTRRVLVAALGFAVLLELAVLGFQGRLSAIPLVFPGLVAVLYAVFRVVEAARRPRGRPGRKKADEAAPDAAPLTDQIRATWIGALVGVLVVAAGVGMVRAAYPPALLLTDQSQWWLWVVLGAVGAVVGGWLAQLVVIFVCRHLGRTGNGRVRRLLVWLFGLLIPLLVGGTILFLMSRPSEAWRIGSTGVLATSFAGYALLIGLLRWLSRRWPGWEVTWQLGFGRRTSWIAMLLATILVASVVNTKGGYHDARVSSELGPSLHRYTDLQDAFTKWTVAQAGCPPANGGPVPLVMVAAPGGGIRAAYWTASSMQDLFGADGTSCASRRVFALSGVSGGSVGSASWVATIASNKEAGDLDQTPRATVALMAEDRALASTMVGLLLRDAFQPLLGLAKSGLDRAALMENGWARSAGVFRDLEGRTLSFAGLGEGLDWVPTITLNGSSVRDGCRVLVSNTGLLPGARPPDCQAAPGLQQPAGPVSGAIDPFLGLNGNENADPGTCPSGGDGGTTEFGMRATTAALLSARFAYVTPSGALRRCFGDEEIVSYDVDGGYYENSGLLTLVQMWDALAPVVDAYNEGELPPGAAPVGSTVQPWIVLLDNHYRSSAISAPPKRPLELLVPLITKSETLSQTALEQVASAAMSQADDDPATAPTYFRLAPATEPGVTAPLGWVLSQQTRDDLNCELRDQLKTVPQAFIDAVDAPEVTDISC